MDSAAKEDQNGDGSTGLKEDCALLNLTIQDAGSIAQDRRTWRGLVKELPLGATASPGH